jgi:hypothetical protein
MDAHTQFMHRFKVFLEHEEIINMLQSVNNEATYGTSEFCDWTDEEFEAMLPPLDFSDIEMLEESVHLHPLPDEILNLSTDEIDSHL